VLAEYKQLIENTKSDLEDHLQDIDAKLQTLSSQVIRLPELTAEQRRIQEERESVKQCLQICSDVSAYVDQMQLQAPSNASTASEEVDPPTISISARDITTDALSGCKASITSARLQLQDHLNELEIRLRKMELPRPDDSPEGLEQIKEEIDSIKQCLTICTQASEQATQHRTIFVEDVSSADDGHQVIVATLGDLISVKRVTAGARTAQWLGQMSDKSLQQLSRDRVRPPTERQRDPPGDLDPKFDGRYGTGHSLASTATSKITKGLGGT